MNAEKQLTFALEEAEDLHEHVRVYGSDVGYYDRREAEPTEHPPGSEGKRMVLQERLEKGLPLWHEQDAKIRNTSAYALLTGLDLIDD